MRPRRRHNSIYTTEDTETILRMKTEGYTCNVIAKRLGRTKAAVQAFVFNLRKQGRLGTVGTVGTVGGTQMDLLKPSPMHVQTPTSQTTLVDLVINSDLTKANKIELITSLL